MQLEPNQLLKESIVKDYFPDAEEIPIDTIEEPLTTERPPTKQVPAFYESDGNFKVFEIDSDFN